jgi:hypothetical protein
MLDSSSGQTTEIPSEQSDYKYPKYPESYTDFIPTFKLRGKQTTVMLADLWSVLEALVDNPSLMQAHASFQNIVDSLPNELIPVRITNDKQDRMLVSSWYIFVDPDSHFTLRPFFQKAIIKFLEEDNFSYLNIINEYLNKISVSKEYSVPALRRADRYKATHNFNISEEQLLATINSFLDSRYISLIQQQESLATLRKTVTEQESHDQSTLLFLNASIDRKRTELFQLKRQFDDQKMKNSSQHKELKKENHTRLSFVDKDAEAIIELEKNIYEKRAENDKIQSQLLQVESRLRTIQNNFNELMQEESHEKIAYESSKGQFDQSVEITRWLAERIEALRVELMQKSEKSVDVVMSPDTDDVAYLTPKKQKNDTSYGSDSSTKFEIPIERFSPSNTLSRGSLHTSGHPQHIQNSPVIQRMTAQLETKVVSSSASVSQPLGMSALWKQPPPPPPRSSSVRPPPPPPPPPRPKAIAHQATNSSSPKAEKRLNPLNTPSRGSLHTSGHLQDIKNSPVTQRMTAELTEKLVSSSASLSRPSASNLQPEGLLRPPAFLDCLRQPGAQAKLQKVVKKELGDKPPSAFETAILSRRKSIKDDSSASSNSSTWSNSK